jgi:hypothetical protein
MLGDEPEHVVRDGELQVILFLLLSKNRNPVFQVRLTDVGHHAPLEAAHQPGLQTGQLLWRSI